LGLGCANQFGPSPIFLFFLLFFSFSSLAFPILPFLFLLYFFLAHPVLFDCVFFSLTLDRVVSSFSSARVDLFHFCFHFLFSLLLSSSSFGFVVFPVHHLCLYSAFFLFSLASFLLTAENCSGREREVDSAAWVAVGAGLRRGLRWVMRRDWEAARTAVAWKEWVAGNGAARPG
jgi:hypothetical protein